MGALCSDCSMNFIDTQYSFTSLAESKKRIPFPAFAFREMRSIIRYSLTFLFLVPLLSDPLQHNISVLDLYLDLIALDSCLLKHLVRYLDTSGTV